MAILKDTTVNGDLTVTGRGTINNRLISVSPTLSTFSSDQITWKVLTYQYDGFKKIEAWSSNYSKNVSSWIDLTWTLPVTFKSTDDMHVSVRHAGGKNWERCGAIDIHFNTNSVSVTINDDGSTWSFSFYLTGIISDD